MPVEKIIIEQKNRYSDRRNNAIMGAKLLQVLAAAYAETLNFFETCKLQGKALNLLLFKSNEVFEEKKPILREQLHNYMNKRSWREFTKIH